MNQTFSILRFGRLLRKYFTDNRGQLLANLGLLICGLALLAVFVYRQFPIQADRDRYVLFFFIGWCAWYVFIMQQTAVLNQKERAITYLMQPASTLEKMVLIWLISAVGYMAVYLIVFGLTDAVGIWFINNREWTAEQLLQIRWRGSLFEVKPFYDEKSIRDVATMWWIFTALFHAVITLLSLLIRRYTMPVSVLSVFGIIVIGMLVNSYLLLQLTGNSTLGISLPFRDMTIESPTNTGFRNVNLPQPIGSQLRYLLCITSIVLLYITAYVRLKEREV